jgi:uncharacterized protein (TIRG00374 family)
MKQTDQEMLILAILLQVLLLFIKAVRWHLLNNGHFYGREVLQRFGEFFESYAIGVITPGRLGELMKAGHAGTRQGMLGAGFRVVSERGLDFGIFIMIAGLAMLLKLFPEGWGFWGWPVLAAGAVIFLLSILILTSGRIIGRVKRLAGRLKQGLTIDHEPRTLKKTLLILLLTFLSNLSYFFLGYLLAEGTGMHAGFPWIAGGIAFAGLINTIPVTIMGLGTRELTFLYVFKDFPATQVLAFSGLIFIIAQAGGGLLSLVLGQGFLYAARRSRRI